MDSTDKDVVSLPSVNSNSSTSLDLRSVHTAKEKLPDDLITARDEHVSDTKTAEPAVKDPLRLKCVVVGDPLVGKTSMIYAFANDESALAHNRRLLMPGMLEEKEKEVEFEGKTYTLVIHDTDYNHNNRVATYANSDLVILCYSVVDVNSLRNVEKKWIPELKMHNPGKPFILVGCKLDMRQAGKDKMLELVNEFDAMHVSADIDSQSFFECSAKTLENIKNLNAELPACVERHRLLQKQSLVVVAPTTASASVYNFVAKPVLVVQSLGPVIRQSYLNLVDCFSNPGAFVERKKAIVAYMPRLKAWIPYEEEEQTAKEQHPLPQLTKDIAKPQLKRLLDGKDEKSESDGIVTPKQRKGENKADEKENQN